MNFVLDFREEHILLVSNWWAATLSRHGPAFAPEPHMALARKLQARLIPSPEKIEAFRFALADLLRTSEVPRVLTGLGPAIWGVTGTRSITLAVEYNAMGLLQMAAKSAGVSDMAFPWKTKMYMRYDSAVIIDSDREETTLYAVGLE